MLSVENAIVNKYPSIERYPMAVKSFLMYGAKKLLHQDDINDFLSKNANLNSFDFIEAVMEYFNFSYSISNKDKRNIPATGRVVMIANHPLGALDALSLIMLVKEVRSDIKVVANDILMNIKQLHDILIPVDNMGERSTKEQIKKVYASLQNDEAVIVFPSGEVSRAMINGIKDSRWQRGFLRFAKKTNSPILPVFIEAKNSSFFYTASLVNKKLSTALLVSEMFKQKSKSAGFKVGELIPYNSLQKAGLSDDVIAKLLKKHLYKIRKGKKGIFATQTSIAHPENRQEIKKELKSSKLLGETTDGKKIYLYEYKNSSILMKEIGRLREYTFRKVEEGTGTKRDTDSFDKYYKHIVLWDEEELEAVGSYRIGEAGFINEYFGYEGFYSNKLFDYNLSFDKYLNNSIELGRSFVQPKFWGTRALDYLWQGIGAYLANHQNVKYMFGPVSLSDMYPKVAKNLLLTYYKHYFSAKEPIVFAKNRFFMSKSEEEEANALFAGDDYVKDFRVLKEQLSHMGLTVPTLYKQYTDLCEEGGIGFVDFNVDKDFGNCVDSFIIVDIEKIKESKRKRYIK